MGRVEPSADLVAELRTDGALGLGEPSSFKITPVTTRIVAVASATAGKRGGEGMVASAAAARNTIIAIANALSSEW